MINNVEHWSCNKCGESRPRNLFGKNIKTPNGLNYTCKECVKKYTQQKKIKKTKKTRDSMKTDNIIIDNIEQRERTIKNLKKEIELLSSLL
jgi:hypothetical protein